MLAIKRIRRLPRINASLIRKMKSKTIKKPKKQVKKGKPKAKPKAKQMPKQEQPKISKARIAVQSVGDSLKKLEDSANNVLKEVEKKESEITTNINRDVKLASDIRL